MQRGWKRAAFTGGVSGIVAAALLFAGLFAYTRLNPNAGLVSDSSEVVLVFSAAGEDGGVVAATVARVRTRPSVGMTLVDTSQTVNVPGTSMSRLGEAYAFGGAKEIVSLMEPGGVGRDVGWVDVSQAAWEKLLAPSVRLRLPEGFFVFDGERFMEFESGDQAVPAKNLRGLVNGAAYLRKSRKQDILQQLAKASLKALAAKRGAEGVTSNLSPDGWAALGKASGD